MGFIRVPAGLWVALAACSSVGRAGECATANVAGRWRVHMIAPTVNYRVGGTIELTGSGGNVALGDTTDEGTTDVWEFPLDTLRVVHDSLWMVFAPIHFRLMGRCVGQDSLSGSFVLPRGSSFPANVGSWGGHRIR